MERMKLKRVLVFAYHHYYPTGGLDDIIAVFDTPKEAQDFVDDAVKNGVKDEDGYASHYNEYQIFDTMTLKESYISG